MALLEVKALTKYFGGLAALSNLDLSIEEGEIRGIIGPNGAGKTTLYNVVSGLYRPTSGKIFYKNQRIDGLKTSKIAKKGLVRTFQRTAIYPDFSVLKNVTVARHLHRQEHILAALTGSSRKSDKENTRTARDIVEFMGLGDLSNELAKNLPHGHQRALGIAIALACEPKVLLLDEPLTGMHTSEKKQMIELVKKVHGRGLTILIVEHDMRSVMELCGYISVLDFGKLLVEGTPTEIQNNRAVIEAYLGTEDISSLGGDDLASRN
jgi:branched-chain amino acid transport system ATP-binding protein